jgi:hypothetical protein
MFMENCILCGDEMDKPICKTCDSFLIKNHRTKYEKHVKLLLELGKETKKDEGDEK